MESERPGAEIHQSVTSQYPSTQKIHDCVKRSVLLDKGRTL
ncbi:hypothetical protein JOD43_000590 [Pullulanibacillus pueri]|nr:hypothetical protein [Pullulanibacillus pueri]